MNLILTGLAVSNVFINNGTQELGSGEEKVPQMNNKPLIKYYVVIVYKCYGHCTHLHTHVPSVPW